MYIRHKMTSFPLEISSIAPCVLIKKNQSLIGADWVATFFNIALVLLHRNLLTVFIGKTQEATLENRLNFSSILLLSLKETEVESDYL